jgi:hypothetical protein
MNAQTIQRGTGITHHARERRSTLVRPIAALAIIAAAGAAHASTISGTVKTGALFSPSNQSADGTSYFNAPTNGPFAQVTIGEFDFTVPSGEALSAATFSGNFGSNTLGSGTAQVNLFLDGIAVASCGAACEAASTSANVAWSYALTSGDFALLSSNANWLAGKAVLTARQVTSSQIVLDPTSVSLTATPVPIPAAAWLLGSALAPLFGLARRKAKAGSLTVSSKG